MGVKHYLQRLRSVSYLRPTAHSLQAVGETAHLFTSSTEGMLRGCETGGLIEQRSVVGHAIEGVVADIVLVELIFPVEKV